MAADEAKLKELIADLDAAATDENSAVEAQSSDTDYANAAAEAKAKADESLARSQATADHARDVLKDSIDALKAFADAGFQTPATAPGNGDGTGQGDVAGATNA